MWEIWREAYGTYQAEQWLFLFFFYNFLGWIFETLYVSLHQHRLENRGFLIGPQIPLYGTGALLMLVLALPFRESLPLVFLIGMTVATALEYTVGLWMEKLFGVRYWDYSRFRFHLRGYICLPASLCWGLFTVLLIRVLHQLVERMVLRFSACSLLLLDALFLTLFLLDLIASVKAALELKDVLQALEKLQEETKGAREQMRRRIEEKRLEFAEKREEAREELAEWKLSVRERAALWEERGRAEELRLREEWRERRLLLKKKRQAVLSAPGWLFPQLMRRHRGLTSRRFGGRLRELAERLEKERSEGRGAQEKDEGK